MLSTGGMLELREAREPGTTAIVATEIGMLHPLRMAAPDVDFVAANEAASCRYMKMITLPKLRDALRDGKPVVKVAAGRSPSAPACRSSAWSRSRRSQRRAVDADVARARVRGDRARGAGIGPHLARVDVAGARSASTPVDRVGHEQLDVAGAAVGSSSRSAGVRSDAMTSPADESARSARARSAAGVDVAGAACTSASDGAVTPIARDVAGRVTAASTRLGRELRSSADDVAGATSRRASPSRRHADS